MPFPSPRGLPNPGIEPRSPAFGDSLLSERPGKNAKKKKKKACKKKVRDSNPPSLVSGFQVLARSGCPIK